ncbi:olfactory receptor 2J1-like [Bombina bombina]|uniref:olfactory receptor 2J1-like n=1 Tax=Bombina bombina TaxID=8345 RepID=UPI00235A7ADC|nr:olfactory receptor 2J1-like [Bombina bombina]
MEQKNQTFITEIVLLGFSNNPKTNITLFLVFIVIYLVTCFGNLFMITIIIFNNNLHTPMYYFLFNLSFLDLCYSSTVLPKLLVDLFYIQRTVSIIACALQLYFSLYLGGTECLILALMAYDRYVAICRPLYYTVLMSWKTCKLMTVFLWIGGFFILVLPSLLMPAPLCNPNVIDHFMCEIKAILKLACVNTFKNELTIMCISLISLLLPFILILASYICIISSISKINSVGRSKMFSTCSSHLMVVVLFFGTALIMYAGPSSRYSTNQQKFISIVYVIITPMLNPLIYSLKNREVKQTFKKHFGKNILSCTVVR